MRLYLAGPMTSVPQFNIPLFDSTAAALRLLNLDIVSPAELDNPETRRVALASPDGAPGSGAATGESWGDFLSRDVKLIADQIDGLVLLPGWQKSRGARLEVFVALLCGKKFFVWSEGLYTFPRDVDAAEIRGTLRENMP